MNPETTLNQATTAIAETRYPTLLKRIQSMFIDALFILLLMFGISALLDKAGEVPGWVRGVIFFGLWGVYEPLSMSLGCTLGNYLIGIRVKKAANETGRINILQSYIRFFLKLLLGWISFLSIHTNMQRRAIHDLAAGSVMTETI